MNKILAAILAATFLSGCVTPQVTKPMVGASVKIDNSKGSGSGVHIGGGVIITAGHVASNNSIAPLMVESSDGKRYGSEVLWQNWNDKVLSYDIAAMIAPSFGGGVAALDCAPNYVGQHIRVEGAPQGDGFVTTWGRVAKIHSSLNGSTKWLSASVIDATVTHGVSGGPVFDEGTNKVVGIVVGVLEGTGYSVMVPAETVCKLLGRV